MSGPAKKPLVRLLEAVVAKADAISYVLLVAGVLGCFALPALERSNNFDENALLAGSAHPTIR